MAAAALVTGVAGRVLLADPVYRGTWNLPGGAVEGAESREMMPPGCRTPACAY